MSSSRTTGTSLRRWLLSLPPVEFALQQFKELLIASLKCGPIPGHVAFVMDGNRRYARMHHVETVEGHNMGFEALARVLEICYKSGVKVVTIYAFSIENFKRSKYEVDALMDMAKTKLVQMSQHGELFDRYGAAVRILGDRSLVREDVLEQVDKAVEMTAHNDKAVLNVCFPYTSREEITHSIRETVREFSTPLETRQRQPARERPFSETRVLKNIRSRQLSSVVEEVGAGPNTLLSPSSSHDDSKEEATNGATSNGHATNSDAESTATSNFSRDVDGDAESTLPSSISSHTSHTSSPTLKPEPSYPDPESITEATLSKNMYTGDGPPLDLLVRTSGVQRLSDFMLWQCHEKTHIEFLDCLWPEFGLYHFLPVLLEWQWRVMREQGAEDEANEAEETLAAGVGKMKAM